MNEIVSNLLVYGSLPEDSILWQLADICEKLKDGTETKAALRGRVFHHRHLQRNESAFRSCDYIWI